MKKEINYSSRWLTLLLMCPVLLWAQPADSTLKDNKVEVIIHFKPLLSDAIKIPVNPNPEKPEFVRPAFGYEVADMPVPGKPTLYVIKPLSMGTMLLPKLKGNYVKLGYANNNMPLAEAYITTVRNKDYNAGIYVKHLSASGNEDYNNFATSSVMAFASKFSSKTATGASFLWNRNMNNWYGSPNDVNKAQTDPSLYYHLMEVKTNSYNFMKDSSNQLAWKTNGYFYHFDNSGGYNENDFGAGIKLGKDYSNIPFEIIAGIRFNNNNIKDSLYNWNLYQRIYFDLNPQIFMRTSEYYLQGGFNSTISSDSSGSSYHFFPKAEGGYVIIKNKLTVYMGLTGNLKPVTYRNIHTDNPFVLAPQLKNTITKVEVYGGLKGELTKNTSFHIFSSSASVENLLTYTKDSAQAWQYAAYDEGTTKVTTLSFSLQHRMHEKLLLGASATVWGYQTEKLKQAYSLPQFETKINALYNISDKFLVKADLLYWGKRNSRSDAYSADGSLRTTEVKLNPFTDLNLGVDYRYSKNLSAFLNFNNIANNKYQRYYQYPVYGLNIMLGFTLTF